MHAAQRGQHHRQEMVGPQGQTKAAEGRLRIASGVDCGMEVRLQVFERGFQRPAFAVEVSHLLGQHLARHIRQDVDKYQTKSFLTQCWYNTSSTSNRFSWHIPHDLMR